MTEQRRQRTHIPRPNERGKARIKLVLLALILLLCGGIWTLLRVLGLHEGLLSLSLPSYRLLAAAEPAASTPQPALSADAGALSVSSVEAVHQSAEVMSPRTQMQPQILIYHTHATEAYLQTRGEPYAESGRWRTLDTGSSVVAVGARLAETLREDYGFGVLHDTENHEPPKLSTAYSRSLSSMLSYRSRYPSLNVYIDVHRDAYGTADADNTEPKDYIVLDGQETARIMFVVGTGKGATGTGFDGLPDFDANYAFAAAVTASLDGAAAGITRDIRVKSGRYNQHVSTRCLLVEVGHNANTLEQALASVPYLAAAIAGVLNDGAIETASIAGRSVWTPQETVLTD